MLIVYKVSRQEPDPRRTNVVGHYLSEERAERLRVMFEKKECVTYEVVAIPVDTEGMK